MSSASTTINDLYLGAARNTDQVKLMIEDPRHKEDPDM